MKRYVALTILLLLAGVVLVACSAPQTPEAAGPGTAWGSGAFNSNGERIYFTATSERGTPITYTGGPDVGRMMMQGSLTCASCHGPNAQGGEHMMHMQVMDAPDIRGSALMEGEHEGGEEEHDGNYDLETFRMAVIKGQHPNGEMLSSDMPRWTMNDDDLADVFDYLMSRP